jgi:hypothetical protein
METKTFLIEILGDLVLRYGVMKRKGLPDRHDQRVGILDERVPGGLSRGEAAGKEALLGLDHPTR